MIMMLIAQVRERIDLAFHVMDREYGVTRLLDPEGESRELKTLHIPSTMSHMRVSPKSELGVTNIRISGLLLKRVVARPPEGGQGCYSSATYPTCCPHLLIEVPDTWLPPAFSWECKEAGNCDNPLILSAEGVPCR